jgi:hypothetical protein
MTGGPLEASVSRTPLTVGDPLVVHLRGTLPRGATLIDHITRVRDTLPEGVRVLSADSLRVENGVVVGRLRVAFFRPDSQVVPSLAIAYRSPSGTDTLVSAAIPIFVHPVLPVGNATLRDVRDVDAPWPIATVAIVLGALLLALLALRALRRPQRVAPKAHEVMAPGPSPYDVALAQLREIERDGLSVEQRYSRAADVVRGYIAAARGVPALERTTREILSALNANGEVAEFFHEADLVKFAGWRPDTYAARAAQVIDALR